MLSDSFLKGSWKKMIIMNNISYLSLQFLLKIIPYYIISNIGYIKSHFLFFRNTVKSRKDIILIGEFFH